MSWDKGDFDRGYLDSIRSIVGGGNSINEKDKENGTGLDSGYASLASTPAENRGEYFGRRSASREDGCGSGRGIECWMGGVVERDGLELAMEVMRLGGVLNLLFRSKCFCLAREDGKVDLGLLVKELFHVGDGEHLSDDNGDADGLNSPGLERLGMAFEGTARGPNGLYSAALGEWQWRTVKAGDLQRMVGNEEVVKNLVKRFSVRLKDTRLLYDTLNDEEETRVRSTIYTFWILQLRYLLRRILSDSTGQGAPNVREHEDVVADLELLSTVELLRLEELKDFLLMEVRTLEIARGQFWVLQSEFELNREQTRHHILSLGLDKLQNLHDIDLTISPHAPSTASKDHLFFSDALAQVIEGRDDEKAMRKSNISKLIIERGTVIDNCQNCHRSILDCVPPMFYNVTNPEDIERMWSLTDFPGWWFSRNPLEMDRVCRRILGRPATMSTDLLRNSITIPLRVKALKEIFTHAARQHASRERRRQLRRADSMEDRRGGELNCNVDDDDDEKLYGKSYKWNPMDTLCSSCCRPILQDLFYDWWVAERVSDRVQVKEFREDCWYGINCRTQRKLEHASRLNHCCPQTRMSPHPHTIATNSSYYFTVSFFSGN